MRYHFADMNRLAARLDGFVESDIRRISRKCERIGARVRQFAASPAR
jgi:hypothetical protein